MNSELENTIVSVLSFLNWLIPSQICKKFSVFKGYTQNYLGVKSWDFKSLNKFNKKKEEERSV